MDYALSGYPLSHSYRTAFERELNTQPQYLFLGELRRLSIPQLIKTLLGLNGDRFFVAVENESSKALLPAFYCIAALARSRQSQMIGPDLKSQDITYLQAAKSLSSMLWATLEGRLAVRKGRKVLANLIKTPRIEMPVGQGGVLYTKSNLTMGLTAGGSVGHVGGVIAGLLDHGYPVDVLAVERPAVLDERAKFVPIDPPSAYGLPYESNLFRYQNQFVREAKEFARNTSHAFLYQRLMLGNYSGISLSRDLNLPLVMEYNGSEVWCSKHWNVPTRSFGDVIEQAEDACLKHAHVVVTVADVLKEELIERGVDEQRIACYPNCIDPRVFDPERFSKTQIAGIREQYGIPANALVGAFIGTFGPWHGAEVLAEAIRNLTLTDADWLRKNRVHFLLVGDGVGMARVKELLSDPRSEPFYTTTGIVPQHEAPLHVAASDFMFCPSVHNPDGSRFFGSPTKLFEYMAMGKPIAASDLEQIGVVLRSSLRAHSLPAAAAPDNSGELAVLGKPGSVEDVQQSIRFFVDQPSWRRKLGENARSEALEKYTWDKHVDVILERLDAVTRSPQPLIGV